MSSSFDLYKGVSRGKRKNKTPRESSPKPPKKSRTEELSIPVPEPASVAQETTSVEPEVKILEMYRVSSPPAPVFEEPDVVAQDEPSHVEEPVVGDVAKVFDNVIHMTTDRVLKLAKHRKYAKSSSSFPAYNFGQAFSRGLNDVTMVSSPRSIYFMFSSTCFQFLTQLFDSYRVCAPCNARGRNLTSCSVTGLLG